MIEHIASLTPAQTIALNLFATAAIGFCAVMFLRLRPQTTWETALPLAGGVAGAFCMSVFLIQLFFSS